MKCAKCGIESNGWYKCPEVGTGLICYNCCSCCEKHISYSGLHICKLQEKKKQDIKVLKRELEFARRMEKIADRTGDISRKENIGIRTRILTEKIRQLKGE